MQASLRQMQPLMGLEHELIAAASCIFQNRLGSLARCSVYDNLDSDSDFLSYLDSNWDFLGQIAEDGHHSCHAELRGRGTACVSTQALL